MASTMDGRAHDVSSDELVESYRRLAEVFHHVLSEHDHAALLERLADTLGDLIPCDALHLYEADEKARLLVPAIARSGEYEAEIMRSRPQFGVGLTGWAVEHRQSIWTNEAHLDPRAEVGPGAPTEHAMIVVPLVARGNLKGALNIYRLGEEALFHAHEFELAQWFGDAAALALDNAQARARLEHLAQTDSLTGLYNHRYFHERLRAELAHASRLGGSVAIVMFDLDDFKRVNDVYGHGVGDQLLVHVAQLARDAVRGSDVVCRIGGEEFGVILPSCDAGEALGFSSRFVERLGGMPFEPSGVATVSMGIARGPRHGANPRELVGCAEAAMMTAKARGKNQVVLYDGERGERPAATSESRNLRSLAHMKLLQSLSGKLNRLNDVRRIAEAIVTELRLLIEYQSCSVFIRDGRRLMPLLVASDAAPGGEYAFGHGTVAVEMGEGIAGRVAERGESLLVPNVLECPFADGLHDEAQLEESLAAVPLRHGSRVTGVIVISKLGVNAFDEDDVRLLEVLAAQASVALENAQLYERQRRETETTKALLAFAEGVSRATSFQEICLRTVEAGATLCHADRASLGLDDACAASVGEPLPSGLEAPLAARGGVRGRLVVDRLGTEDERRVLAALADQASIALQRADHYERLERAFVATVAALAKAFEATDRAAWSDTRWITEASRRVGQELGLEPDAFERLALAAGTQFDPRVVTAFLGLYERGEITPPRPPVGAG
jgi:diguanylate cyclase (GGDEF)-like protein